MGNKYKDDRYLAFLEFAEEDDLRVLTNYITCDEDGEPRLTEELLDCEEFSSLDGEPDQHRRCWKLIAAELQHYGGDTFVNLARGSGVPYETILKDVCDKLGVNYNKKHPVPVIEANLMQKLVQDSWEEMSPEERDELLDQVGVNRNLMGAAALAAVQAAIRGGGFAAYKISLIVANALAKQILGRGLAVAANAGLVRGIGILAGPIGWILTGFLALPAVSGAAYRVTVPSVIQIAYMRQKMSAKEMF